MKKDFFSLLVVILVFSIFFFIFVYTIKTSTQPVQKTSKAISEKASIHTALIEQNIQDVVVKDGDTFITILTGMGIEYDEATKIENVYETVYDVRNLKKGQLLRISSAINNQTGKLIITKIIIEPIKGVRYILKTYLDESQIILTTVSSLEKTSIAKHAIDLLVLTMQVSFVETINDEDEVKIVYVNRIDSNNSIVSKDIIYASLIQGEKNTEIYGFRNEHDTVNYYNEDGCSKSGSCTQHQKLANKELKNFNAMVEKIKTYLSTHELIKNSILNNFESEKDTELEYKAYTEKDKNVKILEKLQKKLPRNIVQRIEEIKITFDDEKTCSATVYIKHGYEYNHKNIAYQIVQEILNILIAERRSPYREHMFVSAHTTQRVKGVTGQNMESPFGTAFYNYTNDSIEWKPWTGNIFGL